MKKEKEQKVYKTEAGQENTYNGYRLDKKAYMQLDAMLHTIIFEKRNPFTNRTIKDMGWEMAEEIVNIISEMKHTSDELTDLVLKLKNEYLIID